MKINFEKVKHKYKKIIRKVYAKAEELTGNAYENAIITVSFVKPKQIQSLNQEYRKIDKVTDVLSFPMLDIKYTEHIKDYMKEIAPDGSLYLGDVVICKKKAKQQAKEYCHSKKREIAFLALHGLLHVYGYDHIDKNDEMVMKEVCKKILDEVEIKRD